MPSGRQGPAVCPAVGPEDSANRLIPTNEINSLRPLEARFDLGDFELQSGEVLRDAFIGYETHGKRIAPIGGTAKTSPHDWLHLEGMKAALQADAAWADGEYDSQPEKGFRAFMTVAAGWFASQTFYRRRLHLSFLGMQFDSMQTFLDALVSGFSSWDANDLICMLHTWQSADISNHPKFDGDLNAALSSIKCPAMVMPCATNLYFPPEDNEIEVSMMPNAELRIIPSIYGHIAGHPAMAPPEDLHFIDQALLELLARS